MNSPPASFRKTALIRDAHSRRVPRTRLLFTQGSGLARVMVSCACASPPEPSDTLPWRCGAVSGGPEPLWDGISHRGLPCPCLFQVQRRVPRAGGWGPALHPRQPAWPSHRGISILLRPRAARLGKFLPVAGRRCGVMSSAPVPKWVERQALDLVRWRPRRGGSRLRLLTRRVFSTSPHGSRFTKSMPVSGVPVGGRRMEASIMRYSTFMGFI